MRKAVIVVIIAIVVVAVVVWQRGGLTTNTMERITYTTTDSVEIVGNYWQGSEDKAALLLHMMPATKESWNELARDLNRGGYHVLAIDLRGHGESVEQGAKTLNFENFTDVEHQASSADVEGAHLFLQKQGITANNIVVGGASIGANFALQHAANHPEITTIFALSPGLDYRGVVTVPAMEKLRSTQKVFLVAAEDDPESASAVGVLARVGTVGVTTRIFETGGHGTTLFETNPAFMDELRMWLAQ